MDQQFLQECATLIGMSIRVVNPLFTEEAQDAITQRIVKTIFREAQDRAALREGILKGYQQQS